MKSVPLFKSHYSLGKSILTIEKPTGNIDSNPVSIIDLALHAKLSHLTIVDDSMTGFLEASKHCQDNKLSLSFGLRLSVTKNIKGQDEASLKNRAKYVVFAKNKEGYKGLINIWSCAAKQGFYYNPCIDFKHLKKYWNDSLILAVPFYDSFLHLNALEGNNHVPEFEKFHPIVLLEKNGLPFDPHLRKKATEFAAKEGFETLETQSIYYRSKQDFIAYATFRCISERTNVEKPELNHFGSDSFNFERWLNDQN